jgi:Tol biopolymer transport system component
VKRLLPSAFCLLLAGPALAQRQVVLPQIALPHHYYYREMYLPQPTSGPSSPTFSPDGRSVIVSWQGSLFRVDLPGGEASQLTDGPGYDYQPDWSPDGKSVVYASYHLGAVELHLLDLATLESRALTRNGAVNVEPRFSPKGDRIAFVSTAYQGRFHIFVLRPGGEPERLTADHKSPVARYYYSAYDHYLSPSWSPDGKEILLVSNRGAIWGTGGFFRMRAEPGAELRKIHDEETNWKARPDWSRRGGRIVYASYLGGAWHQVWLTTEDGGSAFPLTYGDYDAVEPRFSPDGGKVAFTADEGGVSRLRILSLPGGEVREVSPKVVRWRSARGRLVIHPRCAGGAAPVRLSVLGKDGRSFAPEGAWRHADDGFDPKERPFEWGYFHSAGDATLELPAGEYAIEALHGLEFRPARATVQVAPGETREVRLDLPRIEDLPAQGIYSGDLHVHMNYGGAYRNTPPHLVLQAEAEDLHVVEGLIVNKEQRIPDLPHFRRGELDPASNPRTLLVFGQEFHTSYWGHLGLLGLKDHILIPGYAAYAGTPARSPYPENASVIEEAHQEGALAGYVHPFDDAPDPGNAAEPLTNELPVDVALGLVDYYEVVGFSNHRATADVWYRLLNCGFHLPAGAGTDAMANFASLRGPVGMNRVFVKAGASLTHEAFLSGLRAGRTFATNGPLLGFRVGESEAGDTVKLPSGGGRLTARVRLRSIVPVDHLEVVSSGKVVKEIALGGARTEVDAETTLEVSRSGWLTLRAYADKATHPILDIYPFATTSPIYVDVAGDDVRSAEDARFFLLWIGRLEEATRSHPDYQGPEERQEVLERIGKARRLFEGLLAPPRP